MKWIEKRRPREPPKSARTAKVGMNFFVPSNMNELAQFMARELGKEADEIIATVLAEEGQAEKKRLGERLDRASNYADDIFSRVKDNINWAVYENAGTSSENSHALRFGYGPDFEGFMSESRGEKGENIAAIFHFGKKKGKKLKGDIFVKGQAGATHYFGNEWSAGFSHTSKRKIKLLAGWQSPAMEGRPQFLEKAQQNLEERIPARILRELEIAYTNKIGPVVEIPGSSAMKEVR
tara:strand:+ start:97 stop:804 length:708 start_codon:yes stop_codon:yes gene_type:complete